MFPLLNLPQQGWKKRLKEKDIDYDDYKTKQNSLCRDTQIRGNIQRDPECAYRSGLGPEMSFSVSLFLSSPSV